MRVREIETFEDCTLDVAGVPIAVALDASVDPNIRLALRRHFLSASVSEDPPRGTIEIRCEPLPTPLAAPVLSSALGADLRQGPDGLIEVTSTTTVARWHSGNGTISVGPRCSPEEVGYIVGMIIIDFCSNEGMVALHSALISGSGGSALVVGASGQGKSTSAGAALAAGLDVASDDAVLVRCHDRGVECWGMPRTMAVPADMVDGHGPVDGRGRVRLDDHDSSGRWYEVNTVLVVSHGTATETTLEPVAHTRVIQTLLAANFGSLRLSADRQRVVDMIGAVGRLRCHGLALGSDPQLRPATTGAVLRDLLTGTSGS